MPSQLNIIAHITPHPEYLDAAKRAILEIIEPTRAEPGCLTFRLSEDAENGTLHLYEEWRDEEALAAHHEQSYTQGVFEAYKSWLAEEPQILHLRPLG